MTLDSIRGAKHQTVIQGNHPGIIQSMLDYEYLAGHEAPSIKAIIAHGRQQERAFWGDKEIVLPVYASLRTLSAEVRSKTTCVLNVLSSRRTLSSIHEAYELLPGLMAAVIFAEQVPERHSLELRQLSRKHDVLLIGPASVGLLLPGVLKLGAIGGTQPAQIVSADIIAPGNCAVVSTSGGIVNELIHIVTASGLGVSTAVALGGDRYPILNPAEAFLLAEADDSTEYIAYFGELGGRDEYEIADLIRHGKLTKPIVAYVAGVVAELFEAPPQFGHAGAIAKTQDESASAKKAMMRQAGIEVVDSFGDLLPALQRKAAAKRPVTALSRTIGTRRHSMIASHISGDINGDVQLLGNDLLATVQYHSVASLVLSMLLGQNVNNPKTIEFTDFALRLLVDHGPYVSGALNTIVSARAGKDLVSSLASGLLTIGPRFGGAINDAARHWLRGVSGAMEPREFVSSFTANGGIIPGIGHKKYRIDIPDPRVQALMDYADTKNPTSFLAFAREVEQITTAKKGNLILNVDGAIAAVMLDLLHTELEYDYDELQSLVNAEFFNAIFVLSRSIGFTAHYIDQRRHDEGLLRLGEADVTYIP